MDEAEPRHAFASARVDGERRDHDVMHHLGDAPLGHNLELFILHIYRRCAPTSIF